MVQSLNIQLKGTDNKKNHEYHASVKTVYTVKVISFQQDIVIKLQYQNDITTLFGEFGS